MEVVDAPVANPVAAAASAAAVPSAPPAAAPAAPVASAASSTALPRTGAATPGEYLTFRLGGEEYGIDILQVQEIRSYEQPTRIANTPAHVKGVVNLRGVIVPIIDLRLKLGCDKADFDAFTVVIVLSIAGRVLGAVVDAVADVTLLDAKTIKPAPALGGQVDACFINGIASQNDRTLVLMDIASLLTADDLRVS